MAAYLFIAYDVTDPEAYAGYSPGSMPTIMKTIAKHGGKPLAAGADHEWLAGDRKVAVLIEFPTPAAAKAWEDDPEYQEAKAIRLGATSNRVEVICDEFKPPG